MKIIIAPKIGFCFGVKRAVDICLKALKEEAGPCQILGPLVHNELVIGKLKKQGVKFIDSLKDIKKGTVIIPAHGEDPKILKNLRKMGYKVIDATCPLVTRVQNLVKDLEGKGHQIIILGEKNHKEVKSIQASIEGKGFIIENKKDVKNLRPYKNISVVAQTTQSLENIKEILKELRKKSKNIKFYNTLCPTVQTYQEEVRKLTPRVSLMLIVGSKTSANTQRLVEIAKTFSRPVYHIESANRLKSRWFKGVRAVGIAGGTSAPDWLIKDVIKKIKTIKNG